MVLSFSLCSSGSVIMDYNVVVEEEEDATENNFSKDEIETQVKDAIEAAASDEYLGNQPVLVDSVKVKGITFGVYFLFAFF